MSEDTIPKKLSEISLTKGKAKVQEYLTELPESAVQIDEYGGRQFDRYYYEPEKERIIMITVTGKIKVVNDKERNSKYITMCDVDGKPRSCTYSKMVKTLKELLEK